MHGAIHSFTSRLTLAGFLTATLAAQALAGGPDLTTGNLAVVRVGSGAAVLSSASTAVFLEERTTAGASSGTLALPATAAGPQMPFTLSGTATSEGFVTLSADGQYLIMAGFAAAPGTAAIAGTSSATVSRVIARIRISDNSIDTSTLMNNAFSGGDIRSATSDDGSRFWSAGTASPSTTGGVWVASLSASSGTQISTTITNTRVVNIFNRQLYISSSSGTFLGVSTVGANLPTTGGQTITLLNGFPTAGTHSSYDYFFANANTVYVADDSGAASSGGIQKWTLSGGTWSLAYTLQNGATPGVRGLTGYIDGSGNAVLFATTTQTSNNNIMTVTDTGAGSAFSNVVTGSGANTVFRGIRYIASCVPAVVYAQPGNVTVNHGESASFAVSASGSPTLVYQWRRGVTNLNDGGNISGAHTATLAISPAGTPDAGNDYNCVVTNACGSSTSNNATLTVNCASPGIITPPMNQIANVGDSASFSVTASGTGPLQ